MPPASDDRADLLAFLKECELLRDLDDAVVEAVADVVETVEVARGAALYHQGDANDGIYVIRSGLVDVSAEWKGEDRYLADHGPGDTVGELSEFENVTRATTVKAAEDSVLLRLGTEAFQRLSGEYPEAMARLAKVVSQAIERTRFGVVLRISKLFEDVEEDVLEELQRLMTFETIPSGTKLLRQGDEADSLYVVISGRLRIWLQTRTTGSLFLNEVSQGESIGEMGVISGNPRAADVIAIRDTIVGKLSRDGLNSLLRRYPEAINRLFVRIILHHFNKQSAGALGRGVNSTGTFALIPIDANVPVAETGEWLGRALEAYGRTLVMDSALCDRSLGGTGASQIGSEDPRNDTLLDWLNQREFAHSFVVYVADNLASNWSRRCIRQADHVIFVAHAAAPPGLGDIETAIAQQENLIGLRKSLLLLHEPSVQVPSGTLAHLSPRRVGNHHHVRLRHKGDFQRLARFLTGRAVAVVFGGGGARGFAHIGVIRALRALDIPIDLVGGTSMGALIGSQCAMQWDPKEILERTLAICNAGESLTLPYVSLFSGQRFTRGIREMFGDAMVEDLWRRFFSVSCNLSRALVKAHDTGRLSEAVLASNTPPGLFPPKVHEGDLFVDGALLNNVPADLMERYNEGGEMIAIDVNPKVDLLSNTEYDGGLSGLKVLNSKVNPFVEPMNVPNIIDIIQRAISIGGLAHRETVQQGIADVYMRPPVQEFPIMGYANGPKIAEVGYDDAMRELTAWLESKQETREAAE